MTPEQFLEFARVLPEPLLLIAGTGHILAVNPPFARMLAMSSDEICGSLLTDLVATPTEKVSAYLATCARSRAMVLGALALQTRDARSIVCRCEGAVVRPWSKDAPALILMRFQAKEAASSKFLLLNQKIEELSREIRVRQRAEAEAFRQREQLRVTLASIGDAVIATDVHGAVTFTNPVAETLTGWTQEEAVGKPLHVVFQIINEHTRETVENPVTRVLREGTIVGLANHTLVIAKDGTETPIADSGAPIRDTEGALIGVVLVFRDITGQHRREAMQRFLSQVTLALASSLDYQTTLANVTRLAVPYLADWCTVDVLVADGTLQPMAAAHVDPAKEQWVYELSRRYPSDPNAHHGVSQVIRTGKPDLLPQIPEEWLVVVAPDAEHRQLLRDLGLSSVMIVALRARGQTLGALTFVGGGSRRRYGPEDLALAEELAERAAQAIDNARLYHEAQAAVQIRDTFITIAAHELRTPLTSLMGNVQLLARRVARDVAVSERLSRPLQVIAVQADRLNRMIQALLDISRIETGQLRIDHAPVNVGALVRRVVEELHPTLATHTVECRIPDEPLIIEGDELRLEQVLQNLLGNAIKYSPSGGRVEVSIERREERVCVSVRDQGIGIPAQEVPRLFQRFYRASNADTQFMSGIGIGLYVVKEIITLHGGTVEVESIEDSGSTFSFYLPLVLQV